MSPAGSRYLAVVPQYRLIDTAGSVIDILELDPTQVAEDATISLEDGREVPIVEIYDDEEGREGGVAATLVLEIE